MFTKRELLDAVKECEANANNYSDCAKLATFYTLYDHLFPNTAVERIEETAVDKYGDTEFLTAIAGTDAKEAWALMDELMSTLKAMMPKLYNGVMVKIDRIK